MTAELISVGTEILLGNITNTNARYLAEECAMLGLSCYYQVTVGDNEERLAGVMKTALERSDVVLISGGLGPTEDDLTKETLAKVLGRELYEDQKIRKDIENYFHKTGNRHMASNNLKQAQVIEGAVILDNPNGTAPGQLVRTEEGKIAVLMPGPPGEMIPMFRDKVKPYLESLTPGTLYSETLRICGVGESSVAEMLKDIIDAQTNPTIAPYAKTGEVHLRITAMAPDQETGKAMVAPVVDQIRGRLGDHIYTTKDETMEENLIRLLQEKQMTITTAESCTGGLLAGTLINVSGASDVFHQGFITYDNQVKHRVLGVKEETLRQFGAVSRQCAQEMAEGAARAAGADAAISVTGIAGPGGGTAQKPVGLVYIGCYVRGKVTVEECHFSGNRQKVRELTVKRAMNRMRLCLEQ